MEFLYKRELVSRTHQNELTKWIPNERVLERIRGTGFEVLYKMGSMMRADLNLFSALVSCYSIQDNCFNIGGRMITPTLDYVLRIMGLPIDGKPVTGKDYKKEGCVNLCRELLGNEDFASARSASRIELSGLLRLMIVPEDVLDDEGLDIYVRAYVLYVLGCVVFPSSHSKMPSMFLGLLRSIDEIKDYAWGAAFLGHSMNQVRLLRVKPRSTTTGACMQFFMVFLFEYVNGIAFNSVRGKVDIELPHEFPLVLSWSNLIGAKTKDNHGKVTEERYGVLLQQSRIILRPYERLSSYFLPLHLRAQLHIAYTNTILICKWPWEDGAPRRRYRRASTSSSDQLVEAHLCKQA